MHDINHFTFTSALTYPLICLPAADSVKLGDKFDLRLDFRTSRLNGMLVILLNKSGTAALSLELRDGDVRLAGWLRWDWLDESTGRVA